MEKGSPDINLVVSVGREGALPVSYGVTVSYPDTRKRGAAAQATAASEDDAPIDTPDKVLETPATTIARALDMSGWYVLCTAGVDPALYEDIAAYIETQEKMFCYTETGFFRRRRGRCEPAQRRCGLLPHQGYLWPGEHRPGR